MGITKRRMERDHDLYQLGVELCKEVGALEECDVHSGSLYDGGGEIQEAYKLAAARVARGEIELEYDENQRTITDAVKRAYEDNYHADSCMACDRD